MNIFEYIGLPADLRKPNKIFQMVKHWGEVNKKTDEGKLHRNVKFPLIGQVKKDGVFCAVVVTKEGDIKLFSRTGKEFTNTEKLVEKLKKAPLWRGAVYLGELICSKVSLEKLSGIVNPNRVNALEPEFNNIPDLMLVAFFDILSLREFEEGKSDEGYISRSCALPSFSEPHLGYLLLGYTILRSTSEVEAFADKHILAMEEGVVIKCDVPWEAGHKGWRQMKIVKEVTYDLFCFGYEEGTGKYKGKVANLLLRWKDGQEIKAMLGKGYTHEDAEIMLKTLNGLITDPELMINPIGKVFRVRGLQDSSKGKIRLPKVMEHRHDKIKGDF